MPSLLRHHAATGVLTALAVAALSGCSFVKHKAISMVAGSVSDSGSVFSGDNDPELVRDATPTFLKLYEVLLESSPRDQNLLIATCSGFTQYAYAFVQTDADILRYTDYEQAKHLDERALNLYLRAKGYCVRALEVRFKGIGNTLSLDPERAVQRAKKKDVPLLYWSAASWGAAVALAPDRPDVLIDFPVVRALMDRALALDESWSQGALHEVMITLESLETLGGSLDKAREHFDRAVELQHGLSPGPYVAYALGVSVARQDRAEFERLLNQALAIDPSADPDNQLVALITQRRAHSLLEHADALFSR